MKSNKSLDKKERTLWNSKSVEICCENHLKICLDNLNLDPLSIAKFFWEKGIDDYVLIQDFLYLTYMEGLENKIVLFKEQFQAWEEGPVLESVYNKMRNHYKKHGELDSLFTKIKEAKDKTVKVCLDKVYQDYQKSKKKGQEIDFFFKVQDDSWESARERKETTIHHK